MNYEDLEGREISYDNGSYVSRARVVGCDYDIGLSVQYIDMDGKPIQDWYAICLRGPSSPDPSDDYDHKMEVAIRHILGGHVISERFIAEMGAEYTLSLLFGSMATGCAFSA